MKLIVIESFAKLLSIGLDFESFEHSLNFQRYATVRFQLLKLYCLLFLTSQLEHQ